MFRIRVFCDGTRWYGVPAPFLKRRKKTFFIVYFEVTCIPAPVWKCERNIFFTYISKGDAMENGKLRVEYYKMRNKR